MLETDVRKGRKMISEDRVEFIYKCKKVCFAKEAIVVITKNVICPTVLFGEFYDKIKLTMSKGLVLFKTEENVTMEDLEGNFVEF